MCRIIKAICCLQIVVLLFVPVYNVAQNNPSQDFLISASGHYGYIISHRSNMAHLIKGHIYGGELNYIFRTNGSKPWQQVHHYPEIGICFLHIYLANPQQLGNWNALYPFTNIRLNKSKSRLCLNLRIGVGLAYLSKSFDRISNHKNTAIGSHLNGFVNLRLNSNVMLSKCLRLETGIGLSHASNGAIKTPNLGLNLMTVNLGIAYVFGNKNFLLIKDSIPAFKKSWQHIIIATAGIKELMPAGGKKYMAYDLQFNTMRTLNEKNNLGAGIDVFYNNATKTQWADDSIYTNKVDDIVQLGAKVSYAFVMHRISLPIDFGFYFFKKQKENGLFFHRVGIRYRATKHIIANVSLLTHFAKADYFEFGIGYQL